MASFRLRSIFASLAFAAVGGGAMQACIDDSALRTECGNDNDCASGERCVFSVCIAAADATDVDGIDASDVGDGCGSGEQRCDDGCTDTRSDPSNCGRCDNACDAAGPGTRGLCELSECVVACEAGESGDFEGSFEWRCDEVDNDCDGSADEACCNNAGGAVTFAERASRVLGAIAGERAAIVRVFDDSEGSAEFIVDTFAPDGSLTPGDSAFFDCPEASPSVDLVRYSGGGTPLIQCDGAELDTFVGLTPEARVLAADVAAGALEPVAAVDGDLAWFGFRSEVTEDLDAIEVIVTDGSGAVETIEPVEPGGVIGSLSMTAQDGLAYIFGISPFDLGVFGIAVDSEGNIVAGPDPLALIEVNTALLPPLTASQATPAGVWLAWSAPTEGGSTIYVERISIVDTALTAERSAEIGIDGPPVRLAFVATTNDRPLILIDDLVTIDLVDGATGASLASISRTSMPNEIEVDQVIDAVVIGELMVIAGSDTRAETVYQPVALDGTLLCPADQ